MGKDFSSPLTPVEWFYEAHKPGLHLWAPPPVAALIALEKIARSRQKRPHHDTHIFMCQRLLWQEEWRRRFEKEMDPWFIFYPGIYWSHDLVEPLIVGKKAKQGITGTLVGPVETKRGGGSWTCPV